MINAVMTEQTKRKVFIFSGGREIIVYHMEKMPAQKTLGVGRKNKNHNYLSPSQHTLQTFLIRKRRLLVRVVYLNKRDIHWSLVE